MNDVFVYPLRNSEEYKDALNYVKDGQGSLLINGLLQVQNLILRIRYLRTHQNRPYLSSEQ